MAVQKFIARVNGVFKQIAAIVTSRGADDGGKIAALDSTGKFDISLMPDGIGVDVTVAKVSEELSAGNNVNYHYAGGEFSVRKADNSNGRVAHGFVKESYEVGVNAVCYHLTSTNPALSGLTPGDDYWLGTAGGVIDTPLDETDEANSGKISQRLGIAKSATELVGAEVEYVVL